MKIFSSVMFCLAVALLPAALLLYKGETGWLVSFNRASVKDKKKYAKFLGCIIACFALLAFLSALVAFISLPAAVIFLIAGVIAVFVMAGKKAGDYYK